MEKLSLVCQYNGVNLIFDGNNYYSESGKVFHVKNNIPIFCSKNNYSESFGFQWNIYRKTQLDSFLNFNLSSSRFWAIAKRIQKKDYNFHFFNHYRSFFVFLRCINIFQNQDHDQIFIYD